MVEQLAYIQSIPFCATRRINDWVNSSTVSLNPRMGSARARARRCTGLPSPPRARHQNTASRSVRVDFFSKVVGKGIPTDGNPGGDGAFGGPAVASWLNAKKS